MGSFDFEHCRCKQHYACFGCRKAFKAGDEFIPDEAGGSQRRVVVCPQCGEPMRAMGLLFRAPRQRAVKAWRRLEELARATPQPPFQEPASRTTDSVGPSFHCGTKMVGGRCAYCGYSPRAASGGRPSPADYVPEKD